MPNKHLARDEAPFAPEVWHALDSAMEKTARSHLVGRRLLPVDGPFGLGLKSVPLGDEESESGLITSRSLPVLMINEEFSLGVRDVASYERDGVTLDTRPVTQAARECSRLEDEVVFNGGPGVPGLLSVEGSHRAQLTPWDEVGTAANDIIAAITQLDDAGYHGPYSMALAPQRYNLLFRLLSRGDRSELEHIVTMVTDGVHKSSALRQGGVLVATETPCASIVLGQDMNIGFLDLEGSSYEFFVSESLTLRVQQPSAICVLSE
jgi:uncharacterized linocin/CFP29 family protein